MGFIHKKKPVVQHLFPKMIGRRTEVSAIKFAVKQMSTRSPRHRVKDFPNIFYFYGPSGSGKTKILKTAYQDCRNGELGVIPICTWFDCKQIVQSEAIAIESFILGLSQALLDGEKRLQQQLMPLQAMWQSLFENSPPPKPSPPDPSQDKSAPTPKKVNQVQAAYAPFLQLDLKNQNAQNINIGDIAQQLSNTMELLKQNQKPKSRNTQLTLLRQFARIIDSISAQRPLVFFIDNFHIFERFDGWFRREFMAAFENELIFVIAGQGDLSKFFMADFGNLAYCIPVMFFSIFDTELFLKTQNHIQDPKIVLATQKLTKGNPLSVSIVSSGLAALRPVQVMGFLDPPTEHYGDKINKYLTYIMMDELSRGDQNLLAVLAIVRQFDLKLFQHLVGALNPVRTLETLSKKYLFISPEGEMQASIKIYLRNYVKNEMPSLYEEINQGAYDYYVERVREDPENYFLLFDSLYYYFHLDTESAYHHFLMIISYYINIDLDFCDWLCLAVLEAGIIKHFRSAIRKIAKSLGYFRRKDPQGSQYLLEAISNIPDSGKETELKLSEF